MAVEDMEVTHLWNAMKLLDRAFENRKLIIRELRKATHEEQLRFIGADTPDSPFYAFLEEELDKVLNKIHNATHPRDIWPIYDDIKTEYNKRVAPYSPRD